MLSAISWEYRRVGRPNNGGEEKIMKIHGFQTLTLLDFPDLAACTVFVGGCNFRCPFCQNGKLVLQPELEPVIPEEKVFRHLEKRRRVLQGICITGGEPTLAPDLKEFIRHVRSLGYLVKLDTNGYRPDVLEELLGEKLLDYVTMDIKNSPERYAETAGFPGIDLLRVHDSVELLKQGRVNYEFRTTVARELHGRDEMEKIGEWLRGSRRYALQNYRESENVICPEFTGYSREQLDRFREMLLPSIEQVEIRGVD